MIKLSPAVRPLHGSFITSGDKSISHRSVMIGALAKGTTEVLGFLDGADCRATVQCFRSLGVDIETNVDRITGENALYIHGKGVYGLSAPAATLDTANSGTTTRLIAGILSAQAFTSRVSGDASLNQRPMRRVIAPLTQMGAQIESENGDDCCPLIVHGAKLRGVDYVSPVASAQVKSAILLAGLYADGKTSVTEPHLSRNHTELMLRAFGADCVTDAPQENGGAKITLTPGRTLRAQRIRVPGDISSAAFFIAAALIVDGSEIILENVGMNPTRTGFLEVLKRWGAPVEIVKSYDGEEPRADLRVTSGPLVCPNGALSIDGAIIPTLIDELPMLAILAAFANGTTTIADAQELKVKESDRIRLIVDNLLAMGADVTETDDGMIIRGGAPLYGAQIKTHGDHRIAMGFAIAALAAKGDVVIDDETCIAVSYPSFFKDLSRLS